MTNEKDSEVVANSAPLGAIIPPNSTGTQIHFIITGGTIDAIDLDSGTTSTASKIIPYIESAIKAYFPISAELAFLKDSRSITIEDRFLLLQKITESPHARFIITHGTYTMAETGRFLKQEMRKRNLDKTVVLVGAMIPMGDENSDAPFNLGFAVAAVMALPKGAWVAMQATAWDPDDVEKDFELHRFKHRYTDDNKAREHRRAREVSK